MKLKKCKLKFSVVFLVCWFSLCVLTVDGLGGSFAILSGNALFYHTSEGKRIYDLPDDVVWPGILVLAEIPVEEKEFNIYDYVG